MNEYVQMSIDARKKALYDAYYIDDENFLAQLEDMFGRMTQFGETCPDQAAFEAALPASEINTLYYNLCAAAAGRFPAKAAQVEIPETRYSKEDIAKDMADLGEDILDDVTRPVRAQAHQEVLQQARGIPVLGEVMQASNTASLFKKFFGKKKNPEE